MSKEYNTDYKHDISHLISKYKAKTTCQVGKRYGWDKLLVGKGYTWPRDIQIISKLLVLLLKSNVCTIKKTFLFRYSNLNLKYIPIKIKMCSFL